MSEEIRHKILLWASNSQGLTRKVFNDGIREVFGEEGFRVTQELWNKRLITLGRCGYVTISRKGILELSKSYEK